MPSRIVGPNNDSKVFVNLNKAFHNIASLLGSKNRLPSLLEKKIAPKSFVDGNNFKVNIINHLPRLNEFTFNIHWIVCVHNQVNLSWNKNIQYRFGNFQSNQSVFCVDYFPNAKEGHCHIHLQGHVMNVLQIIFQVNYLHVCVKYHYSMNIIFNRNFFFELHNHFH